MKRENPSTVSSGRGQYVLHKAASESDREAVKNLLDDGGDVAVWDAQMLTTLPLIFSFGRRDIALLLVSRGVDFEAMGIYRQRVLHFCANYGTAENAVSLLEKRADMELMVVNSLTPLHVCVTRVSFAVAALPLEKGSNVHSAAQKFKTPLHLAAVPDSTGGARSLLDYGANIIAGATDLSAPLHLPVTVGASELATALLERGAREDGINGCYATAPLLCAVYGRTDIAVDLLQRGAKIEAVHLDPATALHACACRWPVGVAKVLLDSVANVEAPMEGGRPTLHLCAAEWSLEIAMALLKSGFDIGGAADDRSTPLHLWAFAGNAKAALALLENKADVGAASRYTHTPSFHAGKNGNPEIAKELLDSGTRTDFPDGEEETALHAAVEANKRDIIDDLIGRMAVEELNLKHDNAQTPLHTAGIYQSGLTVRALPAAGVRLEVNEKLGEPAQHFVGFAQEEELRARLMAPRGVKEDAECSSSDADSATSSESEMWNEQDPYGSRNRMLRAIEDLRPGVAFTEEYIIEGGSFGGKRQFRLARTVYRKMKYAVLKFFCLEEYFENVLDLHSRFRGCCHICSAIQPLRTSQTGYPPCMVFERGAETLQDWLRVSRPMEDKILCLQQILYGLKHMHSEQIIHCDLKPIQVVFFGEDLLWKLIDLDGARKAGTQEMIRFTAAYAPPEIVREFNKDRILPLARPSLDMWSFGVIAYEVITGDRFYGDVSTAEEIEGLLDAGKVEENLSCISDAVQKETLFNLLKSDPEERLSVAEALEHKFFDVVGTNSTTSLLDT